MKLDGSLGGGYGMASTPLFIAFAFHYITLVYTQVNRKVCLLAETLFLTAIISTLLMCVLRLDGIFVPWLGAMIPIWGVHCYAMYGLFSDPKEEVPKTEGTPLNPNN